jgi:transposase-like protein
MGQILHGSAKTTYAVRAAIQRSKASIKELAERYDLNPKTVMKWRSRSFVHDAPMGPTVPRSTVLTPEEEALAVAFRKHTLLPLDDCLYALQATLPHLTRSSLHRLFQDPQRPHTLRIHLQCLHNRARSIQCRSDPSHSGTKHLILKCYRG